MQEKILRKRDGINTDLYEDIKEELRVGEYANICKALGVKFGTFIREKEVV